MFKLVLLSLSFVWLCETAISSLQLVVANDPYSVLTASKSSTSTLGNSIPSLSNAISEEDKSSKALSEESNESAANSAASSAPSSSASAASSAPNGAASPPSSAPAALTRVKPTSALSSITSTSGLSRGSLLISSSALASASAGSSGTPSSSSPVASARSSATIQHRILPAESIPLPITISTRPGLRTVIAPETITIQQPGIAKVGEVVQQIPTAVSHQRQTVVHNHARVVTPIVAPAVRTVTSQIVRAYHTPLVYAPHVVEN
ncbi:retinin [Cochliomyia hominivorax]